MYHIVKAWNSERGNTKKLIETLDENVLLLNQESIFVVGRGSFFWGEDIKENNDFALRKTIKDLH